MELAAVRRHLAAGTGLLVVTWEAGIGKSHLLAAAVPQADARTACADCLPLSRAAPLMPVVDALHAAWRTHDDSIAEETQTWWLRIRRLPDTAVLPLHPLNRDETAGRAAALVDLVAAVPITAVTNQAERARLAANVAVWRGDAEAAHRLVTEALHGVAEGPGSLRAAGLLTLLARATADLADGHPEPGAVESLVGVRRSLSHDPLGPAGVTADRFAACSQWDAELGRLAGRTQPEAWTVAAGRWDALARPRDAAYSRWRGAQAALAAGHGTALRQAALDARGHVPFTLALRATATAPA